MRVLQVAVALAWLAASAASAAPSALAPCRVEGHRHEVLCGKVTRPLDPARPAGPLIDVHYVVVPAMARRKLDDPVFLVAGGPGQSAISVMPLVWPLFQRLNNRRDIVFVDQRGTGRSMPLACDEGAGRAALDDAADAARQLRDTLACRDRLAALPALGGPGGLAFFTTPLAMQDLDAVREQLGAERINLLGASYGTRAVLDYLRQFPSRVRRAVLDGVAPPDMALPASQSLDSQAALERVLEACAREAGCTADFPNLRADWARLLASLPRQVTVQHPLTGAPRTFVLTRDAVLSAVRAALYSPVLASALPAAIHDAAEGRPQGLAGLGNALAAGKSQGVAEGMHFSVVCSEDWPRVAAHGDGTGRDFGDSLQGHYGRVCAQWPRGVLPPAFYAVGTSPAPVLLMSGGIDPVTPPRHGERVARALGPKARHVVVDNAGHGLMALGCMRDVWTRFIDAPDDASALALDTSCAKGVPRPPAWRPVRLPAPGAASAPVEAGR